MSTDAYGSIQASLAGNSDRNGILNRVRSLSGTDRAVLIVLCDADTDDEEVFVDTFGALSLRENVEVLGAGLSELARRGTRKGAYSGRESTEPDSTVFPSKDPRSVDPS